MLNTFTPYPFAKLNELLNDIKSTKNVINLTIGEPQFQTPKNIQESWANNASLLNKYPKASGEDWLKDAIITFIKQRYDLQVLPSQIIPTFGTREVLFNFPQFYLHGLDSKVMAYPNPFYQIYEGAAIASNASSVLMPLLESNSFKPHLEKNELEKVKLVILNSPNNPTGAVLEMEDLVWWIQKALEYDFVILSDECYSEIYADKPPHSILEACIKAGNLNFKNILAINSISKRSNAPGLRSGYIAGDETILKQYNLFRTYLGNALPLPLQKAAATAWLDMDSPKISREIYAKNLKLASEILQTSISPYTFYAWLKVGNNADDDIKFCKFLYENVGIKILPGSFLGRNGLGAGFVRIALVYESEITKKALITLKEWLDRFKGE